MMHYESEDSRMILLVNACARSKSRTKRLADELINKLSEPVDEIRLPDADMPKVDEAFLAKRNALIGQTR